MAGEFLETTADKFIFKVKKGILYSQEDCWVEMKKDGKAVIGITDFLQRLAGDAVFAETREVGTPLKQGKPMGNLETIKLNLELIAPISGLIEKVNETLADKPELINEDPFGQGWIYQVKGEKIEEEVKTLLRDEEYFALMKEKIEKELDKIGGKE
jgi:glycine cleavage system H protein